GAGGAGGAAAPGGRRGAGAGPAAGRPRPDPDERRAEARERVRAVIDQPTVAARGPVEVFTCQPATYRWLMDHPDQAVRLWRRLGAKGTDVREQGGGRFGWVDDEGGEGRWDCVGEGPGRRRGGGAGGRGPGGCVGRGWLGGRS